MIQEIDVNLLIRGPGILERGPVKAAKRRRQHRRTTSVAMAKTTSVVRLYIMHEQQLSQGNLRFEREIWQLLVEAEQQSHRLTLV
jgi:hypothetical protein